MRHAFAPTDFEGDPTGTANRDPFRSYVVAQISTNTEARHDDDVARSEKCANKKVAAGDTSIQQLKLIGVISRGTMRMATFTDAADVGWVVRLGAGLCRLAGAEDRQGLPAARQGADRRDVDQRQRRRRRCPAHPAPPAQPGSGTTRRGAERRRRLGSAVTAKNL